MEKQAVSKEFGDGYNYQFISFQLNIDKITNGVAHMYPFATDSQRGSFSGVFDTDNSRIETKGTFLGEGMTYEAQNSYVLSDQGLVPIWNGEIKNDHIILKKSCEKYDKEWNLFQKDHLAHYVNTTDRTRLYELPVIQEQNLSTEEINTISFIERNIDLDNNYDTQEYLLYPYGPYYCGSGGCNLYVMNGSNQVVSSTTVTRTPVYLELIDIDVETPEPGTWQDIIVWSNGAYRKLVHDGNTYPSNPSLEPKIAAEEIENHPERYYNVLDYIQ
ncbi:MAG: hypothetical protein ACPGTS_00475 [Minisyncoccia bacterium]